MKANIHPQVYNDTVVSCVCGNSFVSISTKKNITVEICAACHPFYTGQQKFVDTEGRIQKFEKKMKLKDTTEKTTAKAAKKSKTVKSDQPKLSLKEILQNSKEETKE
jgi:large subunit ribosomal protein L31